ncbi:MAG TPA: VTT domain-containing protein [Acidimicrobiales bacterium]|nr:VTT domain-containing protein [Acidimicrobiales bacterium]
MAARTIGVAAAPGVGAAAAIGLLVLTEAGLPLPIPADVVMLFVGERAASGSLPLWVAVLAFEAVALVGTTALFLVARGPGHGIVTRLGPRLGFTRERQQRATGFLERRGRPAMLLGRTTPGLRTVTVVAAGGSGLTLSRALPALVVGSSIFLQLHLFLGFFLGPLARRALVAARGPTLVVLLALVVAAAAFWFVRRRGRRGAEGWAEAACPVCLGLRLVAEQEAGVEQATQATGAKR